MSYIYLTIIIQYVLLIVNSEAIHKHLKSFDEIIGVLDKLRSDYDIKWLKRQLTTGPSLRLFYRYLFYGL